MTQAERSAPYNIEKTGEDAYRLTMAVAGFSAGRARHHRSGKPLLGTGKAQKEDENGVRRGHEQDRVAFADRGAAQRGGGA